MSSVHTQETTGTFDDHPTYRSYLLRADHAEMTMVDAAYISFGLNQDRDYVRRLRDCRSASWFVRHKLSGEVTLLNNACRLRWCPLCAKARVFVIRSEAHTWVKTLTQPKFLTLTLKHSDMPLSDQIDKLYGSFRKLRKNKFFFSKIRGGCWFFQIKRSKDGLSWHPHLHVILDSEYIPQRWLADKWEDITKDSRIIDIRAIHSPGKAAQYVARYAAKPAQLEDYTIEHAGEIIAALHGRRLVGTWGSGIYMSFRPKRIDDREAWVKVGSWHHVVKKMMTSADARAIMKAWQTNTTLDKKHTLIVYFDWDAFDAEVQKANAHWHKEPYFDFMSPP